MKAAKRVLIRALHACFRRPLILAGRLIAGECNAKKRTLPAINDLELGFQYAGIDALIAYAKPRFQYRLDVITIGNLQPRMDWITDPEVFQARLTDPKTADGDCEDYHAWFCAVITKHNAFTEAILFTVKYPGGGHAVAILKTDRGKLIMINYFDHEYVADFQEAANKIAALHGNGATPSWWIAERWPSIDLADCG